MGSDRYQAFRADTYALKGARACKHGKLKITLDRALRAYIFAKLELRWSPEQISHFLRVGYPDDQTMQISHERIYRYVYLHAKKSLRETLVSQLP